MKMLSESSGADLRRAAGGVNLRARTQGLAGRYFQTQNAMAVADSAKRAGASARDGGDFSGVSKGREAMVRRVSGMP